MWDAPVPRGWQAPVHQRPEYRGFRSSVSLSLNKSAFFVRPLLSIIIRSGRRGLPI